MARKVAEGSSVLLKNDNATLPFKAGTRVAVIGDMAATARYQGSGSSKVNATKEENILEEVKNAEGLVLAGYEQGYDRQGKADRVFVEDAVALAGKESVDVVLAVVGLDERSESEALTVPPWRFRRCRTICRSAEGRGQADRGRACRRLSGRTAVD